MKQIEKGYLRPLCETMMARGYTLCDMLELIGEAWEEAAIDMADDGDGCELAAAEFSEEWKRSYLGE